MPRSKLASFFKSYKPHKYLLHTQISHTRTHIYREREGVINWNLEMICIECGTRSNPCRCKVFGPTLGFLAFVATAVVEWPVGALVFCFRHSTGRRIMAHPATVVYPSVSGAIPI
ncbi:uncharacterized protein LOC132285897 [Cornus florida]|uniref:uncharacterized protein LOC132285897 n=1 Tax=Cornus florida TaxID=4283 RepID=UPI00289C8051|nr:uncharacterized protein LOC132285897 [Cornus florida]